jgi:beta-N-acetylhexosaminidase
MLCIFHLILYIASPITSKTSLEVTINGVIMMGDLNSEPISNLYTLKRASKLALLAGADMLILCHSKQHHTMIFNSILNAVKKG